MTENCKKHFEKSSFSLIEGGLADKESKVKLRKKHIPPYQLYQDTLQSLAHSFMKRHSSLKS